MKYSFYRQSIHFLFLILLNNERTMQNLLVHACEFLQYMIDFFFLTLLVLIQRHLIMQALSQNHKKLSHTDTKT